MPAFVEISGAIVLLAAVLTALFTAGRKLWRGLKAAVRFFDDYDKSGGFAGIYKELHPNGGTSLRDSVDAGRDEARTAAEEAVKAATEARAAVTEAQRIGQITEALSDQLTATNERVTEHRRRNDETVTALKEFLEQEYRDSLLARQALESAVSELLMVESHETRPPPQTPDGAPDQS